MKQLNRPLWIYVLMTTYCLLGSRLTYASTSLWTGPGTNFNLSANWSAGVPTDVAEFETAPPLSLSISTTTLLNSIAFATTASSYSISITNGTSLTVGGMGISNQSASVESINNKGFLSLTNSSTIANLTINNLVGGSGSNFFNQSSAGNATIVNNGENTNFGDSSSAGNSIITNMNGGDINFLLSSTAGNATITNNVGSSTNFSGTSTAGQALITNNSGGVLNFSGSATAENSTILNNNAASTNFLGNSNAGNATITSSDGGNMNFNNNSSASNATITNTNGGAANFFDTTTAGNARITNDSGGALTFSINSTGGNATIVNNDGGGTSFVVSANAGNALITNNNNGSTEFDNASTAGNSAIINNPGGSLVFTGTSNGGNATLINNGGDVDLSASTVAQFTAGSIEGSGTFEIGSESFAVGSNDLSTIVSGEISGTGGSLIKVGTGILTLSGRNAYSGGTSISDGTLNLTGTVIGPLAVGSQGTLTGTGTADSLANSGTVNPGVNGVGRLKVASYSGSGTLVATFNGSSNTGLSVTGSAILTGSKLDILGSNFGIGSYNVISAASVQGTFSSVSVPSSAFLTFLPVYTPTDVLLSINFASRFSLAATTFNEKSVAESLDQPKTTSTEGFTNVLTAIAALSASAAQQAFNGISGDALPSFEQAGLRNATSFVEGMQNRIDGDTSLCNSPYTLGSMAADRENVGALPIVPSSAAVFGFWSKGMGTFANSKGDSDLGSPSSHAITSGYQGGYDDFIFDHTVIGLSGAYTTTSLNVEDRNSDGDSTALQSGIYIRYTPGPWILNVEAAYSDLSNEMNRTVTFSGVNEVAASSFQSRVFSTGAKAGYLFNPRNTISFEPSIALTQHRLNEEGFSETGAPGIDLEVNPQTLNSLVSALGFKVISEWGSSSKHPLRLGLRSNWDHEFMTTKDPLTAQFVDASAAEFTVMGTSRDRNAAELGLNLDLNIFQAWDAFLDYSARLSANESSQSFIGGISLKW